MMDVGRHPNIKLFTNSELHQLDGSAGNYKASVLCHARSVDLSECTACGDCADVCPVLYPNEFEEGLSQRHAIYSPFAQAVPAAFIRNKDDCLGTNPIACAKCVEACQKNCIDLDQQDEMITLDVGVVIIATGIDYFDPREASEYGYTRFENVVNSIELERLLSPSGPTGGNLLRFTDKKPPKRVAFIQCVGSRCIHRDIPYCSRICCMNAMKSARLIRELHPQIEIDIFYIDVRAFGKGFEQFYYQTRADPKIHFIKGKPSRIVEDPKSRNLLIHVEDIAKGKTRISEADMVVLSEALVPSAGSKNLSQITNIKTDSRGFFLPLDPCGDPLSSSREGIFLCGCATGPEASGVAIRAAQYLSPYKLAREIEEIEPLEHGDDLRIGVFICHCGSNIAGIVKIDRLKEKIQQLPDVFYAENLLFACSESTQRHIQEVVLEHRLNRIVIAACTPRTHEPVFRETLRKIGFNPFLMEMANIRDQCSWVHQAYPEQATEKAYELIRMGVAKACKLEPLYPKEMEIGHNILVIGGGIAGIETAMQLDQRGYQVYLVEREGHLGGWVNQLQHLYPTGMVGSDLIRKKLETLKSSKIKVYTQTLIVNISGYVGNFKVQLRSIDSRPIPTSLEVGAIVLATGFQPYHPHKGEFGFQSYDNVISNIDMEHLLASGKQISFNNHPIKHVSYIQCIGSRGAEGIPECSRYCCQAAIKQALALRKSDVRVTIFNQDIRVYHHEAETMYREARAAGVNFIRYTPDNLPKYIGSGRVDAIHFHDPSIDHTIELPTDLIVLSLAMRPSAQSVAEIQQFLKVPNGRDGFLMEKHPKFGPVETNLEGVFICGCAQGPKDIADTIAQSNAVAAKIDALLARSTIWMEPMLSMVNSELCRGCATCVDVCEYGAIQISDNHALVNEALCKGCGTCATFCPTDAIDVKHFRTEQIQAMLEACLLEG
jgi:heterodisulfide reductase subunit A